VLPVRYLLVRLRAAVAVRHRDPRVEPANESTGISARPRLHYLDNLRAFAIILVIVLHAAITPTWSTCHVGVRDWLVFLIDVPIKQDLLGSGAVIGSVCRCGSFQCLVPATTPSLSTTSSR
jgi:hypothetical protein